MPDLSYFYGFAKHAAKASKDATKVGAAIVGPEGEIRLTGYNGPPRGVIDMPERFERPAKYFYASHAESNAIAFAARAGISTKDCTIYVTHHPCAACAKLIIQAGFSDVVFGPGKTSMPEEEVESARRMFYEAGIFCQEIDDGNV